MDLRIILYRMQSDKYSIIKIISFNLLGLTLKVQFDRHHIRTQIRPPVQPTVCPRILLRAQTPPQAQLLIRHKVLPPVWSHAWPQTGTPGSTPSLTVHLRFNLKTDLRFDQRLSCQHWVSFVKWILSLSNDFFINITWCSCTRYYYEGNKEILSKSVPVWRLNLSIYSWYCFMIFITLKTLVIISSKIEKSAFC